MVDRAQKHRQVRNWNMTGVGALFFLAGAGLLFLANRYAVFLLLSWGLTSPSAACLTLLFIYGCLFLLCDWLKSRTEFKGSVYFFFRGASLGALYVAPYIVPATAAPIGSFPDVALLFMVGAIIVFAGHLLVRIMFSAAEERSFYD